MEGVGGSISLGLLTSSGFLWLLLLVGVISIAVSFVFILRPIFHSAHRFDKKNIRRLLLVTVPRVQSDTPAGSENNINTIREQIALGETMFAAIGGLKAQRGLMGWLRGRTDHLTFEIAAQKDVIKFYVGVPPKMESFVSEQIHAQYPDAHLEHVHGYNIFPRKGTILGSYLKMAKSHAFPLKTFKTMDSDPLEAITNPLAKLQEGDGAAIQFVIRSSHKRWRSRGVSMARSAKQGKGLNHKKSALGSIGKELKDTALGTGSASTNQPQQPPKQLTQAEEDQIRAIEEKAGKAGLDINIRIVVASEDGIRAKSYLDNIVNAFGQFNLYQYGNTLTAQMPKKQDRLIRNFMYRIFDERFGFVANTEEMASLFHFPLPSTDTPGIVWLSARTAPPPSNAPKEGLFIGVNTYRGKSTDIFMKQGDRRRHFYVIGKSGSGKTVAMQNTIKQDMEAGRGVGLIDPNGDFAEWALSHVPEDRIDDVIYFNPADTDRPMGLNMLEAKTEEQKDFAAQEMISIFYRLVSDPSMIGPMFEHYMRNVMLTLMADQSTPGTLMEIPRMFTDDEFAAQWVKKVKDPVVRAFWEKEMAQMTQQTKSDMLGYLISKVGRFVENEMMRNIIGQPKSAFDFREIMDQEKILIVNLAKGTVGEMNANLIGMILVTKLQMAAFGRADEAEEDRKDFYLYIDEFQNFVTDSIATILSEARKYRLDLIVAHQYLGQLTKNGDPKIRDAVLGNAGTINCFRIGPDDSEVLAKEFAPTFTAHDLMNPPEFTAYVKLLVDGKADTPFNLKPPYQGVGPQKMIDGLRELTRLKYGRDKRLVEAEILERSQLTAPSPTPAAETGAATL